MSSWDEGYVSEIDYTYGYYLELNPHRIKLAFALAGLHPPEVKTAVELGFGQGMSVLLHGAASDISWYGNDFNPAQAAFARSLANEGGLKVDLTDESFAEFCSRDDLPEFDFIGLHGIWSWVNDANRQIIVDFIARKLRIGGVVYLSYNTMPGWGCSRRCDTSCRSSTRACRQLAAIVSPASPMPWSSGGRYWTPSPTWPSRFLWCAIASIS